MACGIAKHLLLTNSSTAAVHSWGAETVAALKITQGKGKVTLRPEREMVVLIMPALGSGITPLAALGCYKRAGGSKNVCGRVK
jgi:hypothetical protein